MRSAPFPSLRVMARVFAKAVALLLVANFLCVAAGIDPLASLITLNTWGLVGHGRPRLYYASDSQNGQLPVEALLAAHAIAYTPKAADEFRVVVLGDSGVLGWGLVDAETFTAQLTARQVRIGGKRVVAYNLAYPVPSAGRDVLLLDAALRYQPDLVIWFVTAMSLRNPLDPDEGSAFLDINRERLERLTNSFGLQEWFNARMLPEPAWYSWIAIHNADVVPVWLNSLAYPFLTPAWGQTGRRLGSEAIPAKAQFVSGQTAFNPMPNVTWQFLTAGQTLADRAGARLLLVNEPILVGSGPNSDINYNLLYERALYDQYREALSTYASRYNLWYIDLWNAVPAANFTDTAFHTDAAGWSSVADRIISALQK
jgi:hypothetical protein